MGKRGPKPKGSVSIKWSADFAYVIGLLVTDGCLSKDGRHIDFTSTDLEQIRNFQKCLKIKVKIGTKDNGNGYKAFRVQFGDIIFYNFLEEIGLTKAKSLTVGEILVPGEYFFDFLRGCFDGDGTFYSYWDSRWKSSHMFYMEFISGSHKHIDWLRKEIKSRLNANGHLTKSKERSVVQLKYAKREALEIISKMYYASSVVHLSRKYKKIKKALIVEKKQQLEYK